jgi:hypothetical protein
MGNSLSVLTNVNVSPFGVWVDTPNSKIYYTDPQHHRIYSVPKTGGSPAVFGGTGVGDYVSVIGGSPAASTPFNRPHGIVGYNNVLYVCDTLNFVIRAVSLTDTIVTTVAGIPKSEGYSGDGLSAINAHLWSPFMIWIDNSGNKYFTDLHACTVRMIDSDHIISTIIGIPHECGSNVALTGPGTSMKLNKPYGITGDNAGSLFIADSHNNMIRQYSVSSGNIIHSWDGTTFSGSNSPLSFPTALTYASVNAAITGPPVIHSRLFIAENSRSKMRSVIVDTGVARDESASFGSAKSFSHIKGVATDSVPQAAVDLYVGDARNHRVVKLSIFDIISGRRRLDNTWTSSVTSIISEGDKNSFASSGHEISIVAFCVLLGLSFAFFIGKRMMKKTLPRNGIDIDDNLPVKGPLADTV